MVYEIIVTRRAELKFDAICLYLDNEWGVSRRIKFTNKLLSTFEILKTFPRSGRLEFKNKSIRGLLVVKQIKLFYRIEDSKIIIINLFDTRQHPSKRLK